jgi:hypothetical protein
MCINWGFMITAHITVFKFTQQTRDITLVNTSPFGFTVRSRQKLDSLVLLRASEAMKVGAVEATELSSRCTGSKALTRTSLVTTQEKGKSAGNTILLFSSFRPSSCPFTTAAVTRLHASRSQKNRATLQHEQRSPGEWRQLKTRSVAKLATLNWWLKTVRKGGGGVCKVFPWPRSTQFGDGCYTIWK